MPIIGIEPALKPAVAASKTGVIGVMATRGTLNSEKFRKLLESLHGNGTFVLQPCDGLADAIERADQDRTLALCRTYTQAMGRFGMLGGEMDCLVLGCTHYTFAASELASLLGAPIQLLEGGAPVARQTRRQLEKSGLCLPQVEPAIRQDATTAPLFYSTGNVTLLESAVLRWLDIRCNATALA
jgi:glutamate racemase